MQSDKIFMLPVKLILAIALTVSFRLNANAQISFGPEAGFYFYSFNGVNDFDSIRVVTASSDMGEMFFGGFFEYVLTGKLSLHSKLSIRPVYIDHAVYNYKAQCLFCNVTKGALTPITNLTAEVMPQVEILNLRGFKVQLYFGMNLSLNIAGRQPEYYFNGRHEDIALVMNSLGNSVIPVTAGLSGGVSLEYKRFALWSKYQFRSRFSNSIEINGQNYPFINTWEFMNFSLGYRFFGFKRAKSDIKK